MSTLTIKKEIIVEAGQERAFSVFTDGIDRWWPRDHHIGSSPLKRMLIEPKVGGRWYSISEDGSEANVGKVLEWSRPNGLVLTWQITADWKYDPSFVTEVEIRFVAEAAKRTRVQIEHRHLERYGSDAEKMRAMFDSSDAWVRTLGLFGGVANREAASKFVLHYEASAEGMAKVPLHYPAHSARVEQFHERGVLLMIGVVSEPAGSAMGVFTTRQAAEEFVHEDPFVLNGVVSKHTIREWLEIYNG
jgi:uncharacterized protein YciI/uncharacterized protein YndB with AHSA1/START domain